LNLISFHKRVKHSGFNSSVALDPHKDAVLTGPWKTVRKTYFRSQGHVSHKLAIGIPAATSVDPRADSSAAIENDPAG
jgi:hypothetical protein